VAALHHERKIVRLPNRGPELLGIAGFRGTMAPVYDLGAWLGYPRAPSATWLVIARGKAPSVWRSSSSEAHVRVAEESISSEDNEKSARHHVRGAVRAEQALRPIIHIASILDAIARLADADGRRRKSDRCLSIGRSEENSPSVSAWPPPPWWWWRCSGTKTRTGSSKMTDGSITPIRFGSRLPIRWRT